MQTRRLHVSGLTPAISESDLTARFNVFGNVKAVDGFGKLDALGQPRKFAFVSLEAPPDKHSKCLNVLSGSTWKGTRLRIGEAKLDYAQKLEKERIQENEPATKRRRLTRGSHGTESKNMTVVTSENVDLHPGWKRTALSHLVFPVRMRPLHPIDFPKKALEGQVSKRKRRRVVTITRARRRKIDPTLYGAVHQTEEMLQAEQVIAPQESASSVSKKNKPKKNLQPPPIMQQEESEMLDLDIAPDPYKMEKARDLSLLSQLFAGKEVWDGKEDDVTDMEELSQHSEEDIEDDESAKGEPAPSESSEESPSSAESIPKPPSEPAAKGPPSTTNSTKLRDLFAIPTQEPGSILAGLDLDLALDDEFAFDVMPATEPVQETAHGLSKPLPLPSSSRRPNLDSIEVIPNAPYFFPLLPGETSRGNVKDLLGVGRSRGWMDVFFDQPSSEEIRKRWDTEKAELTRDWKERHREATKRQRRAAPVNGVD